jgi:hypothetical protein
MLSAELAPIVLFVYNRPWHTKQVLDALALNKEAKDSELYIYCDGAKENATEETLQKIKELRLLINSESRFKKVIVKESLKNKGLANSIIEGVTEVIKKYERIIVLEDDLVPSLGFLNYMNNALHLYENESKVSAIHGWSKKLGVKITQEETFFVKGADCWGWATWRRNWELFNYDAQDLYNQIIQKDLVNHFNLFGAIDYMGMLKMQIDGKVDSWAIRWQASMFLENKLCLHPTNSLIKNIGMDGSGVHNGISTLEENIVDEIVLKKIDVEENIGFYFAMQPAILSTNNKDVVKQKITFKELKHSIKRFLLNK